MAISKLFTKEQVTTIINNLRINIPIDVDYIYDVYEAANEVIEILDKQTAQIEVKEVNQFDLVLYSVGEYFYSVSNLKEEDVKKFKENEDFQSTMASVVADKYLSLSIFKGFAYVYISRIG